MTRRHATRVSLGPQPGSALLEGLGRGVGWTYLGVLVAGLATLTVTAWAARRLGTTHYGVFVLAASVADLLVIVETALGLSVVHGAARVTGSVSSDERASGRDTVHTAHWTFVAAAQAVLGLTVMVVALDRTVGLVDAPGGSAMIALLGATAAVSIATAALPAVVVGSRRFSRRASAAAAGAVVRLTIVLLATGRFGLPALAAAQLAGVCVERALLAREVRRNARWFAGRPQRPAPGGLWRLAVLAGPLLVLNLSGQLFAASDLVTVGLVVGASAVGQYQLGALVPIQLRGLLITGYNVVFPAISGTEDRGSQEAATAFVTRVFSFVGGAVFVLVAMMRHDLVHLLLGRESDLAADVVVILCATGMADLMLHGSVTLLLARGNQAMLARTIAVELPLNLLLTVAAVLTIGPVGAALATLFTVMVMDFVAFPVISRGQFGVPALRTVWRHGIVPASVGSVVALAAAPAASLVDAALGRLVVVAVVAAAVGSTVGLTLAGPSGRALLRSAFRRAGTSVLPVTEPV